MATITPTRVVSDRQNATVVVQTWAGLANGDVGAPVELSHLRDRTVQVAGTFGVAGNVRIEGSLDGITYDVLSDPLGTALDFTSGRIDSITEVVRYVRPRVTGGDGTTALTVHLLMAGTV